MLNAAEKEALMRAFSAGRFKNGGTPVTESETAVAIEWFERAKFVNSMQESGIRLLPERDLSLVDLSDDAMSDAIMYAAYRLVLGGKISIDVVSGTKIVLSVEA